MSDPVQAPPPASERGRTKVSEDYGRSSKGPSAVEPSALESKERAIIGTLLAEYPSGPLPETLQNLLRNAPQSFDDLRFGTIATAIRELALETKPIHILTVCEWLHAQGKCDDAGGSLFISQLASDCVTLDIAEFEAGDVWSAYQIRRSRSVLSDALTALDASPDRAGVIISGVRRTLESLNGEASSDDWASLIEDGADILKEDLPDVEEIVEGIVAEQCKLVIGSGSKSFKTWLSIDLGLSLSQGVPFLDRKTTRVRVLYVNLELRPQTFKRRVQIVAKAKHIVVDRDRFQHLPLRGKLAGLPVREIVSRIIRLAQKLKARVVLVDPIYKLNVDDDENSASDQTKLFNELDRLTTEAGCTVVLNDHFSKGNQSEKDPLDAIRGSSAKGGDVDAAMVLRKHEVEGCYRVDIIHRELAPVEPFVIGWDFPLMQLRPDLDAEAMKKSKAGRRKAHDPQALCSAIADSTAEKPVSIAAWAKAAGINRTTLNEYLPGLRVKGWIATVGEGNSARQFLTENGQLAAKRAKGGA